MTRQISAYILIALAAVAGTRYLWPRVEYKHTVEQKEVVRKDVVTVIKEVVRKDGSRETVTEIVDRSRENSSRTETKVSTKKSEWSLSLLLKSDASKLGEPVYGLMAQRRLLGPVWVGVGASTDRQIMATIGLEF